MVSWFGTQNEGRVGYDGLTITQNPTYANGTFRFSCELLMQQNKYTTYNYDGELDRRDQLNGSTIEDYGTVKKRLTNKVVMSMNSVHSASCEASFYGTQTLTKQIRGRFYGAGGAGSWGSWRSISVTVPRRPTGTPTVTGTTVVGSNITNTSIRVNVSGGSNFLAPNMGQTTQWWVRNNTTGAFVQNGGTFTGLTPGTTYTFQAMLRVFSWDATKDAYSSVTSAIATSVIAPGKPNPPTASVTGSTTTTVTKPANPSGDALTHWQVGVFRASDNVNVSNSGNIAVGTSTYGVTGLTRTTGYYYRVRFLNAAGWGPWSNNSTTYTTPAVAPSAPTGNGATSITSVGATVQKGSVSDNGGATVTGMQIELRTNTSFTGTATHTVGSWSAYVLTGLVAATNYYYKVRVSNSAGYGSWSAQYSFKTVANMPDPPDFGGVEGVDWEVTPGSNTVDMAWEDKPVGLRGATILGYQVQFSLGATFASVFRETTVATNPCTVGGLLTGTVFYVRVRTVTDNGTTDWSVIKSFVTTGANEPPPIWVDDPDSDQVGITNGGVWQDGTWYEWSEDFDPVYGHWIPRTIDELAD